jgi:hypothetical protein
MPPPISPINFTFEQQATNLFGDGRLRPLTQVNSDQMKHSKINSQGA